MSQSLSPKPSRFVFFVILGGLTALILGIGLLLAPEAASAQSETSFHPPFALLDHEGRNVLDSGAPVSTMQTCGNCHDTAFIAAHSGHADAGLSSQAAAGDMVDGRPWDTSSGPFGRWDPIDYRLLSPEGDPVIDLTTAEWIIVEGARHVGGGPALAGRDGMPLGSPDSTLTVDQVVIDAETGVSLPWDWAESGTVEMNCFLCHTAAPNNAARIAALANGDFGWASTATLEGTGIVQQVSDDRWMYLPEAFGSDGSVQEDLIRVHDPSNSACGQCHGQVNEDTRVAMTLDIGDSAQRVTLTTGQVFSPQRLSNTGVNFANKETLAHAWDVHAERAVQCIDCHYALNNPVFDTETRTTRPDHLVFDPRRMDFGEYLEKPLHEFANADAQPDTAFGSVDRDCASCHDAISSHDWLPYAERHVQAVACETCHVPRLYGPAVESIDWTVLTASGEPIRQYRGLADNGSLVTGWTPVLLANSDDSAAKLAPYNLVTAWYWVYSEPARPVPLRDLQAAWLSDGVYAPEVLAAFDADGDGVLQAGELRVDSDSKISLITARLAALGLENPRIVADVQPYAIHHNVVENRWATRECRTCHGEDSRLNGAITLTSFTPGGVLPNLLGQGGTFTGHVQVGENGGLTYVPDTSSPPVNLYVLGHDSVVWIDAVGMLLFIGVFGAVVLHGGLRYLALRRLGHQAPVQAKTSRVYMYTIYERQWHWLQTAAIFGLLFTGLVIHRPNLFSMFSFEWVVPVHNALALLLVINAALSAFYHLVSGEIRQYLPRPYGFFDQAFEQAKYYLVGIFKGAPHPFDKTPERKLNPLQQLTYLGILNVLLPLQIITGALMWAATRIPWLTEQLGGLPFLAPAHTLIAWMFATFIVMHVYLTTTGHTPLANIKAMMLGWDEVEGHVQEESSTRTKEGAAP